MGLFYNYENSGSGVAKNGPKKKPFFRFWEQFASKFWKLITVNFLYFMISGLVLVIAAFLLVGFTGNAYLYLVAVPVLFLFGPATAAVTQVMRKFVLEKPIFLWDEFKTAYKNNFRQALPVGIFDMAFCSMFIYGIIFYSEAILNTSSMENYALMIISAVIAVYFLMAHFYIYLEIVSLTLPLGKIVKNALLLTIMGIKVNIINFIVWLLFITAIILFFPYSVFVLPVIPFAWLMFLSAFNCYPVIQKYIINPYYESKGMKNPELPDDDDDEDRIFTDRGGSEPEIVKQKAKGIGQIIR